MERRNIFRFISHEGLPYPASVGPSFATGTAKLHHLFWSPRATALVAVVPPVAMPVACLYIVTSMGLISLGNSRLPGRLMMASTSEHSAIASLVNRRFRENAARAIFGLRPRLNP